MRASNSGVGGPTHTWIRQHVLGLVAIFIALTGTAVAAQQRDTRDGPKASASVVTDAKFKKLKQRVAALERRTTPIIPTTLPPSGPASGDLTGNYPNPEIGLGKVGAPELADFSVGESKFAFDLPWVRATRTANQTIPMNTDTALAFDSERFDSGTLHNNVTNNSRLTAPGPLHLYLITASVQFAPGAGQLSLFLVKNGTTTIANETRTGTAGDPTSITISTITFLGTGAYLEAVVRQGSGAPLDVVKANEFSPEFAMALLPSND